MKLSAFRKWRSWFVLVNFKLDCMANMTNTQQFCFKLVNSVLDTLALYTKGVSGGGRIDFVSKDKTGFNPRTRFDRIIEAGAFDMLQLIDPAAGFCGGESGRLGAGKSMWIVDAVGGAKAFACGSKIWGTLLAFAAGGYLRLGALDHPGLHERLIGIEGKTYWSQDGCDFRILKTATEAKQIRECVVATSSYSLMDSLERNAFAQLADVATYVIFDYDCYAYTLLAKGQIDAVVDCRLQPHEFVGLAPILKGAGCVVSDWSGRDVCYSKRIIAARTAAIRDDIIELMTGESDLSE
ncbi:MAG: inositol monophosphatase family protein [Candidatus Hodgkinia cicadicola]